MTPLNSIYICQSCGAQTRQFFGRCSTCGDWNSIVEELNTSHKGKDKKRNNSSIKKHGPKHSELINELEAKVLNRLTTGYTEFDRVLGGGIVPGSLVLVGGDPGIGKSTLLLQCANFIALKKSVLYISAEESAQQVRLRWKRLEVDQSQLRLLSETNLDLVIEELESFQPEIAIIDSIQALNDESLSGAPGSVGQVRECSAALQRLAKQQGTALILVGHVTKEGALAGPKVLEHLVDVVLTFEGDRFASHRLLRAVKNRYGATHELGVFEMQGHGLIEITNPSEIFLNGETAPGLATIVACEGTRCLAVEIQALINTTTYASPRRTATGIGTNRLHQILAVLEKHLGIGLSRFDCYLAVAGGLEVEEPAADLGIAVAIVSSFKDLILPPGTILIGELGLGGQLRPVTQINQRLQEAERLGFKRAITPRIGGSKKFLSEINLDILEADNIADALTISLNMNTIVSN